MGFVTVRCRPLYLPREFTTIFIICVYILPRANANEMLCELYRAGDFNHANLKAVLSQFHKDVYTNIPGTYRAEPCPTSDTQITSLLC